MTSRRPATLLLVALVLLLCSCRQQATVPEAENEADTVATAPPPASPAPTPADTPTESKLRALGLVDIHDLDSSILVNLAYASPDNFLGCVLYHDLHKAFFLPQLATKIAAAQSSLRRYRPDLTLVILDAARPLSVQRLMFHKVQGTPLNIYVANPVKGPGLHNYGAAVDATLADTNGNLLPMGSDFDHFGPESHTSNEQELLSSGRITQQEFDNRRLLRSIMRQQGLLHLHSEWWHFSLMSRQKANQTLTPIDI